MTQRWEDYEKAADKGPFSLALKIMLGIIALCVIGGTAAYALGWFGEAAQVAKDEYGPKAALRKYEWFKDAAQQLLAKKANIEAAEKNLADAQAVWKDKDPASVPRDVREEQALRRSELLGLKASYNQLAADYNAAVKKVNWGPMNTENLPAEFTQYVNQ